MSAAPMAVITFAPEVVPTAVYVARAEDGSVLYVGMTGSLCARFAAHEKADLWWAGATAMTVEMWPSRAADREAHLILQLDPPHNRAERRQLAREAERQRREEILIEMYGQGVHLSEIADAIGVGYNACAGLVGGLRKAGRLDRRPKPAARKDRLLQD